MVYYAMVKKNNVILMIYTHTFQEIPVVIDFNTFFGLVVQIVIEIEPRQQFKFVNGASRVQNILIFRRIICILLLFHCPLKQFLFYFDFNPFASTCSRFQQQIKHPEYFL